MTEFSKIFVGEWQSCYHRTKASTSMYKYKNHCNQHCSNSENLEIVILNPDHEVNYYSSISIKQSLSNFSFVRYHSWKKDNFSVPRTQEGVCSYSHSLSLMQVMSLFPERLYPGMQLTSTVVPWSTGSEVLVCRSKISGSPVHLSEDKK